jgi:hypothetical protein
VAWAAAFGEIEGAAEGGEDGAPAEAGEAGEAGIVIKGRIKEISPDRLNLRFGSHRAFFSRGDQYIEYRRG